MSVALAAGLSAWGLVATAHAGDATGPADVPKAIAPEEAFIVVSPDGFWFPLVEEAAKESVEQDTPEEAEAEQTPKASEEKAPKEVEAEVEAEAEQADQTGEEQVIQERPPAPVSKVTGQEMLREPGAAETFAGIAFAWIPAGEFLMGSKLSAENVEMIFGGKREDYRDELPQHDVTLSKGFWMGRYEVTNAQFEQFASATGYRTDAEREGRGRALNGDRWEDREGASWRTPGWDPQPTQPVVLVSWRDAQAHVDWLNTLGQGRFRLPSEAEWEYACRADGFGVYSFGDYADSLPANARYRANALELGEACPAPVGTKLPNPWNLYDMHGNVGEWCRDGYDAAYYTYSPAVDPQGPEAGAQRVVRGGSWYSYDRYCRSASRTCAAAEYRYVVLGYRLCRDDAEDNTEQAPSRP